MSERLTILADTTKKKTLNRLAKRQETEEYFNRLWKTDPKQFDPNRSARERERIQRTWALITSQDPIGKVAIDIPCGWGNLSFLLKKSGMEIVASDIAERALDRLIGMISVQQEYLPHTTLKDDHFDLVVSTDAISYLSSDDFRLYFAELARIIKSEGLLVCSTNIDIYSEDALQRFIGLVETEFEIKEGRFSYHAYQIRLCNFLDAPRKFITAFKDSSYLNIELNKRRGLNRLWFKLNSTFIPAFLWRMVSLPSSVLYQWVKQSQTLLLFLEKVCRFFSAETGISHVIVLGKRRPLFTMPPTEPLFERKKKREVWE